MPLILSRRRGETLVIDGPCTLRFLESRAGRMTVEIVAAPEVTILRGELANKIDPPGHDLPKKIGGKWRYHRRSEP